MARALRLSVLLATSLASLATACGSNTGKSQAPQTQDTSDYAHAPKSCAYTCPPSPDCPETSSAPYACPAMADYGSLPHDDACGAWDGSYPAPAQGRCSASAPAGEAARYAGPDADHAGTIVLPDARRITPAGADWVFGESDLEGGLTTYLGAIPNTRFVVAIDDGPRDHAVRVIDATKIGGGNPVTGYVKFADPDTLNSGAAFVAPDLLYVATDDGVVQAMKIDTVSGSIARDDARSIQLPASKNTNGDPAPWYVASIAVSPDGKRLVATGVNEHDMLVYDVGAASPAFRKLLGKVDLGEGETFAVAFDPNDAGGATAYVSMWAGGKVIAVDVSTPSAPKVAHAWNTSTDPEGLAFLDGRWMVVANDLGDTLSVVDRASNAVTSLPVDTQQPLHGAEPSAVAWDGKAKRLYVALSGRNAVAAYDVDTGAAPPSITPAGEIPTGWWPSGVVVESDGSLVVSNMRGHGTGPRRLHFDIGNSDIDARLRGGIQRIPAPSSNDLSSGSARVAANDTPAALAGAPAVSCPAGASDFPVPATNTQGPSPVLSHVIVIVRENKGFDSLFGDLPGANGEASYTFKTSAADMDGIWRNVRALARTFAASDNYYTDAVYSTQGHVWATFGRTNDFNERTWAISGSGRSARPVPGGGVFDVGRPVEGSIFDWALSNQVQLTLLGEIVGDPKTDTQTPPALDGKYPGGPFQNIGYSDLEKACYASARARVFCNLGQLVYMTLPNDHTFGVSPKSPTPETFCAVNDEATGMILDAISHSPIWASSVVFITEDDPSQGGEHVDSHRAPLVVISPWVKRGYVSHTHIDVPSLHKIVAHVFGKPYANALVAGAALPLDLFTSTPDFTPYTYAPRTWPLKCGNGASAAETTLSDRWDFDDADEQPGLDSQVTRWMRGIQR